VDPAPPALVRGLLTNAARGGVLARPHETAANLTCLTLQALVVVAAGCSVVFPSEGGGSSNTSGPKLPTPTGCPASPNQPLAPGGYYVNGNTICTAAGKPHLFHGVDRPSLEWRDDGERISLEDFQVMASWKANVVRLALNQDFWLAESPIADPAYPSRVDDAITWANMAGMDVILDLHWTDGGVLGSCDPRDGCQHVMADKNSITFWSEVAARYKDNGRVAFELFNEPHDIAWPIWKSGGQTTEGWVAAGMQQMYDAVRAAGAHNLVVIGGVDWAFDLSGVLQHKITGYNIVYATHPYGGPGNRAPEYWDVKWGFLTHIAPVMATEFGDLTNTCDATYTSKVIAYADTHNASWSAWGWYPGGCMFPALIADWTGTPSESGAVVKAALYRYAGLTLPDAGAPPDGGTLSDGSAD
jgi:endoglucanase